MLSRQTSAGKPCVQASETPNAGFRCIIRNKTLRDGRRHGLVLSESICGLVSTFPGLRSNDLSDECCFFLPKGHTLRGTLTHGTGPGAKGQG